MAIDFPGLDDDGNEVWIRYYSLDESAKRLHVSRPRLRRKLRSGEWPHLDNDGRLYMSAADQAEVVRRLHVDPPDVDPDAFELDTEERRLGIVRDPDERDDTAEGGVQ